MQSCEEYGGGCQTIVIAYNVYENRKGKHVFKTKEYSNNNMWWELCNKICIKEKVDHRLFLMFIPSFTKCGSGLTCYWLYLVVKIIAWQSTNDLEYNGICYT